jgi:hypothetical protein
VFTVNGVLIPDGLAKIEFSNIVTNNIKNILCPVHHCPLSACAVSLEDNVFYN